MASSVWVRRMPKPVRRLRRVVDSTIEPSSGMDISASKIGADMDISSRTRRLRKLVRRLRNLIFIEPISTIPGIDISASKRGADMDIDSAASAELVATATKATMVDNTCMIMIVFRMMYGKQVNERVDFSLLWHERGI